MYINFLNHAKSIVALGQSKIFVIFDIFKNFELF